MAQLELEVVQTESDVRIVERLPDGSTAVFDGNSKTVYSLNVSAAAAWEACRNKATLGQIMQAIETALNAPVTEEAALAAVSQLEEAGLVTASYPGRLSASEASRRSLLKAVGALGAAAPLVLALKASEQRAFAALQSAPH